MQQTPGVESTTTVYVGNLPFKMDEETVRETFSTDCGPVKHISWQTDKATGDFKGFAFIEFMDPKGASNAVSMNGSTLFGRNIKVQYSHTKPGGRGGFSSGGFGGSGSQGGFGGSSGGGFMGPPRQMDDRSGPRGPNRGMIS